MPLYDPKVVPVTGPQGLQQWSMGVPDLGGGAYVAMAKQIMSSMDKTTENIGSILQQRQGTSYLLGTMANAKVPGTDKPMFDPEIMNKLAKGPLAAQQQFLGSALTTFTQNQQAMSEQNAQQRMLEMYQQNPNLLRTKMNMVETPGQRPPMSPLNNPGIQITQNPGSAASGNTPASAFKVPDNAAAQGYYSQEVQHNGNKVHALLSPDGKIVNVFNPDGTTYNP